MNLKKLLAPHLPENLIGRLVRGYDVIGDVAIIKIPAELENHEARIAEALLAACPRVRVVGKRDGFHSGEYRVQPLKRIGGSGSFVTVHKEFGVRLHLDPSTVYFSPRSAGERCRIAGQVRSGERVLVMFSGIAPLPLMIAKHAGAAEIVGVEKNPAAHVFAVNNIDANSWAKNVTLLHGDVGEIAPRLEGPFDRIAMPLPVAAGEFLELALDLLGRGGRLHFYDFQGRESAQRAVEKVALACRGKKRILEDVEVHVCGHVSPGKYRVCVDASIGGGRP